MKLLFVLLLFTLPINQDKPAKGTNIIYITTELADEDLYKRVGQLLLESGYTIAKSDRDFMQVQTDTRKIKGANAYPRLVVSVSKGKAKVSGYFGSSLDVDPSKNSERITYRGMRGSPFMAAFDSMHEFANKLAISTGATITYAEE